MNSPERRQAGIDVMVDEIGKRLDKQDVMLVEIRNTLVSHLAVDKEMRPALDELVSLWKGSKVISAILAALFAAGAALWGLFVWAKDHIK
ncbi:MAG: hypothetical protein IT510_06055 [Sulfuritalea sp.]|nr:hypothetical protein [Sulfuritalea sp.]